MADDRHVWDAWLQQMHKDTPNTPTTPTWHIPMPTLEPRDDDPGPNTMLFYAKQGGTAHIKKYQKQGKSPQYSIDLHHQTLEEARQSLDQALTICQQKKHHRLLIVHGKGTDSRPSTLKRHVYHWLKNNQHIMGLHSAPNQLGGAGALMVYLKKQHDN